ncbi:YdaS family helix-turn-helix protein [Glaciimonas sp. PAMC28666]|uniref:YdaS family helix-turn-helix protein n=1 Tax=Glaciimonas sp. PAMC28666 TaxID=2807626 RepID=UPI0019635D8A|nr:YdaS family helix-turn-helix protein [Glaciimonas sp. PAMC28666]QRX82226.1 helix-turn-helix domain-containing protein [Glaciimonas sp. PAMC28666]
MLSTFIPNPIADAIDYLGGDTAVAKRAGLKTSWAVAKWRKKLPAERTIWLAKETGFIYSPHVLNPTMYPNPKDGLPRREGRNA